MLKPKTIRNLFGLLLVPFLLAAIPHTTYASSVGGVGGSVATPNPTPTTPSPSTPTPEEEEEEEVEEEEEEPREPGLFPDIEDHWAEEVITTMVGLGLMMGTSEESFDPDGNMTRAEFVAVVVRNIYPTIDASVTTGNYWYSQFFAVAQAEGLLPSTWREKYMDNDITRQEMAFVINKAIGTEPETLVTTQSIPDYSFVTKNTADDYRSAVLNIYSFGLMGGKTPEGHFAPAEYGTRAECAVVLLNYVDSNFRVEVEFEPDPNALTDINRLDLTFTKNREVLTYDLTDPNRPVAKVGDTVIVGKEELTVLAHPSGAVYSGMYIPYLPGVALDSGINTNSAHGIVEHGFQGGGIHHGGDTYYINPNTKEGYWSSQWAGILKRNPSPAKGGTTEGEVTADLLYSWSATQKKWIASHLYEPVK